MSTTGIMTARQWAQLFGLGLALAAAIVVMVAVVLPAAAMVLALALTGVALATVAQRATTVAQATRARVGRAWASESAPQPTLRLELPGGAVVSARPVPLPGEGEQTMLLTRDGYVVVSAEGRVLHRIEAEG